MILKGRSILYAHPHCPIVVIGLTSSSSFAFAGPLTKHTKELAHSLVKSFTFAFLLFLASRFFQFPLLTPGDYIAQYLVACFLSLFSLYQVLKVVLIVVIVIVIQPKSTRNVPI